MKRLSYANVVATLALFLVVAGGSAFAATQLGKNSVGSKQLKPNAVTAAKIKIGAVTPAKLNGAAKAALTGPRGPQGPQGVPGAAKAWAEVDGSSGAVVRSSGGVSSKKETSVQPKGYYCVNAGAFNNSNSVALVNLNYSDAQTTSNQMVTVSTTNIDNECADGEFAVRTLDAGASAYDNAGFIIVIF